MQDLVAVPHSRRWLFIFVSLLFLFGMPSMGYTQNDCDDQVRIPDTVRTQTNCSVEILLEGLEPSSVVWKDLNSSRGAFLRYLDCEQGCTEVVATIDDKAERFIHYEVCGNVSPDICPLNYEVCDTIVLEVVPTPRTTRRIDICEGFSYEWQGRLFREEGFYTDTLVSSLGCDSLVSLDLKVNPSRKGETSATICPGEYYELGGERFGESGTYEVTLTDSINCDSIVTLNLEVLPGPVPRIKAPPILCHGSTAELRVPHDESFSNFKWSNGANTSSIEVSSPGMYSVTVSSPNGCTTPVSYELKKAPRLDASIDGNPNMNCNNPVAILRSAANPDPAAAEVTLEWTNEKGRKVSDEPEYKTGQAGWYFLKVNDASGYCSDVDSVEVTESPGMPKFSLSREGVLNCQTDTVMISVDLESNLPNQFIRWTGPGVLSGKPTLGVTEPGWYIMEVTNLDNNCTVLDSIRVPLKINELPIKLADEVALRCDPAEVSLKATVDKGTPLYHWYTQEGRIEGNPDTQQVTVTQRGWYFVDVKDEPTGCVNTDSVLVKNAASIKNVGVEVKASCSNDPGGLVEISGVEGGKTPYRYTLNGDIEAQKGIFANLDPGNYRLQVTDGFGCRWDSTLTIEEIAIDSSLEEVEICQGISYEWNGKEYSRAGLYVDTLTAITGCDSIAKLDLSINGSGFQIIREETICPGDTFQIGGQNFTKAGTYKIPIAAANICDTVVSLVLTHFPVDTPEIQGPPVVCEGDSVQLSVSNNFVAYEWSTGSTDAVTVVDSKGDYEVTVTDGNGCRTHASYNVKKSEIPVASISGDTLITCEQPFVQLEADPSLKDYSLTWFNPRGDEIGGELSQKATEPGAHVLMASDPTGTCFTTDTFLVKTNEDVPVLSIETPPELTCQRTTINLSASVEGTGLQVAWSGPGLVSGDTTLSPTVDRTGLYRVKVTHDSTGCSASATVQVREDRPKTEVSVTGSTKLNCSTGETTLVASSPDATVSYQWQTEEGVITGPANGPEVVAAEVGWYELITTDLETGCPTLDRVYVDFGEGPKEVKIRTIPTCENEDAGYVIVDKIIDGEPLFRFSLNGAMPPDDQGSYSHLAPGTYQLDLIDSKGCVFPSIVEVDSLPVPETIERVELCEGESFTWKDSVYTQPGRYIDTLQAASGCDSLEILELEFLPAPRRDVQLSICEGEVYQMGDTTLTEPGIYTFSKPNPEGCDSLIQVELTVFEVDSLIIEAPPSFCSGETVRLQSGGNFAAFEWNTGDRDSILEVSVGGRYTQTATTAEGCSRTAEFELQEIAAPVAQISGDSIINCQESSVVLSAVVQEDSVQVSISWRDSSGMVKGNGPQIEVENSGMVFLEVSDPLSGCMTTDSLLVQKGTGTPEISLSGSYAITCREPEIVLQASLGSDTTGRIINWTGPGLLSGGETLTPRVAQPGIYELSVRDTATGCTASDTIQVLDQSSPPQFSLPDSLALDCISGEVTIQPVSSENGLLYKWFSAQEPVKVDSQSAEITVRTPGIYHIEARNGTTGCLATDSVLVSSSNGPKAIGFDLKQICAGDGGGFLSVREVNGGTGPFVFALNDDPYTNQSQFSNIEPGQYTLRAEDSNGCSLDTTLTVLELPEITVDLGENQKIIMGDSLRIDPAINLAPDDIAEFRWTSGDNMSCRDCLTPVVTPEVSSVYRLEVVDSNNCRGSGVLHVAVDTRVPVFIPSGFSPNGDGINDRFMIFSHDSVLRIKELLIFNRWGETIFQKYDFLPNNPSNGWDGRVRGQVVKAGVYVYYTVIQFHNGKEAIFKGDITLMR